MTDKPSVSDRVDLEQYIGILLRRRWIVLLSFVGVLSSALIGSLLMTPIYEATTTLQIEERELTIGAELLKPVEAFIGTRTSPIDSEVEILKSRSIAEVVVRKLNLDKTIHEIPNGVSLSITPIATDSSARPGTYTVVFDDGRGHYRVFEGGPKLAVEQRRLVRTHMQVIGTLHPMIGPLTRWVEEAWVEGEWAEEAAGRRLIGEGEAGRPFNAGGLAFTISDVEARPGDEIYFSILDFQRAVARLRKRTKVVPLRATNIIAVTVQGETPQQVASAANAIAEAHSVQNLKRKTGQAFSAREFLEEQLRTLRDELTASEKALEDYKTRSGVITLGDEVRASLRRLTEVELEKATVEAERREAESLLAVLKDSRRALGKGLLISASGIRNPVVIELSAKLTELEVQRSSLETVYTPRHPAIIQVETQIEEVRNRLIEEAEGTVDALRERELAFAGIIERYEKDLQTLPEAELNLVALVRTSKVNEGIYTFLLQKYEEARIAEASEVGNVRIIDAAISPRVPIKPRTKLNALLGAFTGLMMGLALAFFRERLDNSIKTGEGLERASALPLFGLIPEVRDHKPRRRMIRASLSVQDGGATLITRLRPRSMAAEAYRSLRTNIQYADPDRSAKAVLLTSAAPREGKSTVVANLAIALAEMDRQVLVVDTDLRRPTLHSLFGCPRKPGLTEILVGKATWRSAVHPSEVPGLAIIACGANAPNPVELLGSKSMMAFLDEVRAAFDVVLFDSPPTIAFADACVLGSRLDCAFLVVEAGKATPKMVARARAILENVNVRVVGSILNKVKVEGFGYGYYAYPYYYKYSKYYDAESEEEEERSQQELEASHS